jgi:hypothetical protein
MRQILSSIGILILLCALSLSDFALSNEAERWDDSQQMPCVEFELPAYTLTGTDTACFHAALLMQTALDRYGADCLLITNKTWIPTRYNPVDREWVQHLIDETVGGGYNLSCYSCSDNSRPDVDCGGCFQNGNDLY